MSTNDPRSLRNLLDRLSRVIAAEEWSDPDLNPAQRSALAYLSNANEFSRAPSNVADYLCTTRGTASQSLKALERKGFIALHRSAEDKRSVRYDVTKEGRVALSDRNDPDGALAALTKPEAEALSKSLEVTVRRVLERRGFRSFGLCRTCHHHQRKKDGAYCGLLAVPLSKEAANQLCHEHAVDDA